MNRSEEMALIELAASGDRVAAGRLIQAHQASVYAYILRLSGRTDIAEDIVQDAFVRVLTNLNRFDPRFRFSTWLFTIAKRLYVNASQKHKPVYNTETVDAWRSDGDDEPSSPVTSREQSELHKDAVTAALLELTLEQREVIVLFHQQEWPITLIAEYLGMPEGTVKSHLHRGRRRMRRYFEQHMVKGLEVFAGVEWNDDEMETER
ncbi:MAG: RNA polymerase sigma factor [Phycisphaerales bacterium]